MQMLGFTPTPSDRKRGGKSRDDDDAGGTEDQEENCNMLVSAEYSAATRRSVGESALSYTA